jgi:hypothetical protein
MAKCRIVAIHARRRGIAEPVGELVKRVGVRALVADGALESGVDTGLPQISLKDPRISDSLGRFHVAGNARLGTVGRLGFG